MFAVGRTNGARQLLFSARCNLRSFSTEGALPQEMRRTVQMSTLPNGMRVVSQPCPTGSPLATLGLILPYGCRFDSGDSAGHAYFINKLALGGTKKRPKAVLVKDLEMLGGSVSTNVTRESLQYAAAIHIDDTDKAVELLADVALHPVYTTDAIAQEVDFAQFLNTELVHSPEQFLPDLAYAAAFGSTGLGNPLTPTGHFTNITPSALAATHAAHFHPSRMILAAIGVPHERLLQLAHLYFGHVPAASTATPPQTPAQWVGQDMRVALKESSSRNPYRLPLTQLALVFPGYSWGHKMLFTVSLVQCLLGGGQSFSSGGPGKGMYSRLYTHVLNNNPQIFCATALHAALSDTGLFTIHCSSEPHHIQDTTVRVLSEIVSTLAHCKPEELERARNMLKGLILMNLESKAIACEDICRQVLMAGRWQDPISFCDSIDKVTMGDVQQVLYNMLNRRITIAAYGDLSHLPTNLADGFHQAMNPVLRSLKGKIQV
eukprot:m.33983 g.33983  ORF g.33983 m.33983 type:complete len:489 (+) comp9501_c0_seq2:59-1525(+)